MIKRLWRKWIYYTAKRAGEKAWLDTQIWGNSVIEKKWWGYRCIPWTEFIK